ncbi:MAG: MFS transporter, partial [Actinobacteria bacterium]|nr:MFS transporter [Actinomycetota bacterium]
MRWDVRPAVSVRGLFALMGVAIAAFFPFFPLLLSDRGLRPDRIGAVLAAMAAARLVVNPLWGHAADTWFGRVRTQGIAAWGAASAALALLFTGGHLALVVAVSVALATCHAAIVPLADAIALDHLGDGRLVDYGRIRLWASAGFAAAVLAFGGLFEAAGIRLMLPAYAVGAVAVAAWSSTIARDEPRHAGGGRFGSVGAAVRAAPRIVPFLGGALLVSTAFAAAWSFLPLRIVGRGGGPFLVGLAATLGATAEIPVMRSTSRLTRRVGLRGVYVLGCATYVVVFAAWGLVRSPVAVSLLNTFEGVGFALLYVGVVVIVGR